MQKKMPQLDVNKSPINNLAMTSFINKTARNKDPNRTGVSFFQGAPSLASYDNTEHHQ